MLTRVVVICGYLGRLLGRGVIAGFLQSPDTEAFFFPRKQLYSCCHCSVGFVPKKLSPKCYMV